MAHSYANRIVRERVQEVFRPAANLFATGGRHSFNRHRIYRNIRISRILFTERQAVSGIVAPFISKVSTLDFDTVQIEIARALLNVEDDPEDTVTAACSLIEAICRSILIELGLSLPPKKDIDGLLRAVQEPLGLSPGRTNLPSDIERNCSPHLCRNRCG